MQAGSVVGLCGSKSLRFVFGAGITECQVLLVLDEHPRCGMPESGVVNGIYRH